MLGQQEEDDRLSSCAAQQVQHRQTPHVIIGLWPHTSPVTSSHSFLVNTLYNLRLCGVLCPCNAALLCLTLLYSALHCFTLLYSALHCSTLLYSALICSTLLYSALLCSTLLYSALLCFTLLYSALLCSTLL